MSSFAGQQPARRRRADGEKTHRAILEAAVRLATTHGLEGLSIGALATATGVSKSGLFAHFGSKEGLQLATIEEARRVFVEAVVAPALRQPDALSRLTDLCERYFDYVGTYPGGCFFVSASSEMKARPGILRDRLASEQRDWIRVLRTAVVEAQAAGQLPPTTDPDAWTFQLSSMLIGADITFLLQGDPGVLQRARAAIHAVLQRRS